MWVRVDGLVQGVGFRAFALRRADDLGVTGWVMNSSDGGVEIEAQAAPRTMEQFLLDLGHGPRMSRVDDISVESVEDPSVYETFELRW